MRGVAPLIVTILGVLFLAERLDAQTIARHRADQRRHHHASPGSRAAITRSPRRRSRSATRSIIAVYTLIDGAGARAAGNPWSYVIWLSWLEGFPFLAWVLWTRGRPAVDYIAAPLAPRR